MENNTPHKTLYRSNSNKIIFGVAGGLGEYFNVDPIIFRIGFVVLSFGGGSGLLVYVIMALLMPKNPSGVGEMDKK
ncbi:MAG: PspC domain-containing protein [bacterium]|nr:PspC domain-containing protein [bacterium]